MNSPNAPVPSPRRALGAGGAVSMSESDWVGGTSSAVALSTEANLPMAGGIHVPIEYLPLKLDWSLGLGVVGKVFESP